MLAQWLQFLESKKQESIERIKKSSLEENKKEEAILEIEVNWRSVGNYLKICSRDGLVLKENLDKIEEVYNRDENYREIHDRISDHFSQLSSIPQKVERGEFEPIYTRVFNSRVL